MKNTEYNIIRKTLKELKKERSYIPIIAYINGEKIVFNSENNFFF